MFVGRTQYIFGELVELIGGEMNRSDLRKQLLRYYEMLREIKSIQARTISEKENRTREILALEKKIYEIREDLYDRENKR